MTPVNLLDLNVQKAFEQVRAIYAIQTYKGIFFGYPCDFFHKDAFSAYKSG